MNRFIAKLIAGVFALLIFLSQACAFVPEQPTMRIEQVRPGMKGYALTVLQGQTITRLPLEVISVLPRMGNPQNLILIKVPSGIAAGMSGSPVYLSGKLVGAIGYGFVNADHTLGMVTPIDEMSSIFSRADKKIQLPDLGKPINAPLALSGAGRSTADALGKILGSNVQLSAGAPFGGILIEENARFSPGEAVMAFIVWGDVLLGATGTLTAVSKDGRFLAFAHPFLELGAVQLPIGRARIHHIVQNNDFPFKIGSPVSFVGTITQDRPQAIGGVMGSFPLSVPVSFIFKDKDSGKMSKKGFNIVQLPFVTPKLISTIFSGLIRDEWERNGHGTLSTTFSVLGRGINNAWRRSNLFFSESKSPEIIAAEIATLIDIFLLNPFSEIYPIGFSLNVEVAEEPKVLFIEGISFDKESAAPGDSIEVGVKLRPWRKAQQVRSFDIKIPEKASGTCEVVVRGGSIDAMQANAVLEGWKSIDSFERLITELDAVETNNELIVEFNVPNHDRSSTPNEEYLSEVKKKRLEEGSMRIFKSEFVVDGLMRKQFEISNEKK